MPLTTAAVENEISGVGTDADVWHQLLYQLVNDGCRNKHTSPTVSG